jgi:fructose-1,6-bisphosphatase/inositol monophosphatase family enzyme
VVTDWDLAVERFARHWLRRAFPAMAFVGEETGGALPEQGWSAAVDPIDGSWSFVSRDATFGVSLAFFDTGRTVLGLVLNPSTGELAYAGAGAPSRLIQFGLFGEGDAAVRLPWCIPGDNDPRPLVNLQPSIGHRPYARRLKDAWDAGRLRHVKSSGGSPALALLEAAKGRYVYVHPWAVAPSAPYDLSAAVTIVTNAGGQVVTADGDPVAPINHRGLLVAGVDAGTVAQVRQILTVG